MSYVFKGGVGFKTSQNSGISHDKSIIQRGTANVNPGEGELMEKRTRTTELTELEY